MCEVGISVEMDGQSIAGRTMGTAQAWETCSGKRAAGCLPYPYSSVGTASYYFSFMLSGPDSDVQSIVKLVLAGCRTLSNGYWIVAGCHDRTVRWN